MHERERELTWHERIRWGDCPACKAKDGELCDHHDQNGERVHLGRLQRAPQRIREVPLE